MDAAIRTSLAVALLALAGTTAFASDEPPATAGTEPTPAAADADAGAGEGAEASPAAHDFSAIEATGRAIFEHDRAAAVATDVAMSQRAFKRDKRVRGC